MFNCFAKCFIVLLLAISQNVSFCLFCEKQGSDANETFRKTATNFVCFAVKQSRNQQLRQKPLTGRVKSTTASIFRYCFAKCSIYHCFGRPLMKRFAKRVRNKRKISRNSRSFHLFRCFAKQKYTVSSKTLTLHPASPGFPRNIVSSFLFSDEIVSAKFR